MMRVKRAKIKGGGKNFPVYSIISHNSLITVTTVSYIIEMDHFLLSHVSTAEFLVSHVAIPEFLLSHVAIAEYLLSHVAIAEFLLSHVAIAEFVITCCYS